MNEQEFETTYCRTCGSQRWFGISDTEMREGCSYYQRVILGNKTLTDTTAIRDRNECPLCKNDKNFKINFISGMNCQSSYSTFDLGMTDNIRFCPRCGRKL